MVVVIVEAHCTQAVKVGGPRPVHSSAPACRVFRLTIEETRISLVLDWLSIVMGTMISSIDTTLL